MRKIITPLIISILLLFLALATGCKEDNPTQPVPRLLTTPICLSVV